MPAPLLSRSRDLSSFLHAIALAMVPGFLSAATLVWDGNPATPAVREDGGGSWNLADTSRWYDSSVPGYAQWTNNPADTASFGNGTAGVYAITLAEPITAGGLIFNTTGYSLSGSTLTLAGAATVTANVAATISSSLTGGGGMIKDGAGTLTLSGNLATTNSLTGTTTINAGTLVLAKTGGAIALNDDVTVVAGGTLQWSGSNQIADSADLVVSGGLLNFGNASDTFASYTQSAGGYSASNAGTVNVTGAFTMTGGNGFTINSNGVWSVGSMNLSGPIVAPAILIGGNGAVVTSLTIGAGGLTLAGQTINLNGASAGSKGARITLNGDFTSSGISVIQASNANPVSGSVTEINLGSSNRIFNITGSTTLTSGLSVVGTGGLTKTGAGTLSLNMTAGSNSVDVGPITVNEGLISWNQIDQIADTTAITVSGGGLSFNGRSETFASYTQTSGTGLITGAGGSSNTVAITGALTASGGTTITVGSGTTLSANSINFSPSLTGTAVLLGQASTTQPTRLVVGSGGLTLSGQTISLNRAVTDGHKGNEIQLNGNVTATGTNLISLSSAGPIVAGAIGQINLGGTTRTWDVTGGTVNGTGVLTSGTVVGAPIVGAGGLTKVGTGILAFSGANDNAYAGLTSVNNGMLYLNKTATVNALAGDTVVNGVGALRGVLFWNQSHQIADTSSLTVETGGLVNMFNRNETLLNITKTGGGFTATGGEITVLGLLRVSGGNSNTTDLSVSNFRYTVNSNGKTSANAADFTGSGGNALLVGGNSTDKLTYFEVGAGGLVLSGNNFQLNRGTVTTPVNAFGSELTLLGDITASGANRILADGSTLGVAQVNLGSTGSRTFNITGGNTTINTRVGVIGSAGLTKTGPGILQFNDATSYTGKTTITAGTLKLGTETTTGSIHASPWIAISTAAVFDTSAVAGGYTYAPGTSGVISGTGTVQGSLNLGTGKVLKPGDSSLASDINTAGDAAGTLTISGSLVFNPDSLFTMAELNVQTNGIGDKIVVGGGLGLSANSNLLFTFDATYVPVLGGTWDLIDWAGALSAAGFNAGTNLRNGVDGSQEGNLNLPNLTSYNPSWAWQINNYASAGVLNVSIVSVPEPGRMVLLLLGLICLTFSRKRRPAGRH